MSRTNIKISDTSLFRSWEVLPFVPTFMQYISLMIQTLPNNSLKLFVYLGLKESETSVHHLDVLIRNLSKRQLITMLRNILISFLVYQAFMKKLDLNRSILSRTTLESQKWIETSLEEMSINLPRIYKKYSTEQLLRCVFEEKRVIQNSLFSHCVEVLKIDYSPSVYHLAKSLILCELNYTQLYADSVPGIGESL